MTTNTGFIIIILGLLSVILSLLLVILSLLSVILGLLPVTLRLLPVILGLSSVILRLLPPRLRLLPPGPGLLPIILRNIGVPSFKRCNKKCYFALAKASSTSYLVRIWKSPLSSWANTAPLSLLIYLLSLSILVSIETVGKGASITSLTT